MGLGIDPTGQRFRAVAGCDVDHDTPIKIDKARHKHGSVIIGRRKPCGFIHPQRPGLTDALGVLDERLTVFVDGVHHRVPRDPELPGDLRYRAGIHPNLPAAPHPGATGQDAAAAKQLRPFRPRLNHARGLHAPVPAFSPHQPGRPTERRQVMVGHRHPAVTDPNDPTRHTPHQPRQRLNLQRQKPTVATGVQHMEARQTEHDLRDPDSVTHVGNLPIEPSDSSTMPEVPDTTTTRYPHPSAKTPFTASRRLTEVRSYPSVIPRRVAQWASSCRLDSCNLRSTAETCDSTVRGEICRLRAICLYA